MKISQSKIMVLSLYKETGVVHPKRRVVQSVSRVITPEKAGCAISIGVITHTSICHVYRIDVC